MRMKIKGMIKYFNCLVIILVIAACNQVSTPKPRGYFRIDLPEKKYQPLQKGYPFSFQYPNYGQISEYQGSEIEGENTGNWLNIDFPEYNAHLYLTFKTVEDNLGRLIEDSHEFVYKHVGKADAIGQTEFVSPETSVYGLLFDVVGNTASAIQFYATDSTSKFLRGALYFDCEPNMDSLYPLIRFFREDIEYLMETLKWEETLKVQAN